MAWTMWWLAQGREKQSSENTEFRLSLAKGSLGRNDGREVTCPRRLSRAVIVASALSVPMLEANAILFRSPQTPSSAALRRAWAFHRASLPSGFWHLQA